jgi:hypothetical protein
VLESLTDDQRADIDACILAGEVIEAIRRIRTACDVSQGDAMDLVRARYEQLRAERGTEFTCGDEKYWLKYRIAHHVGVLMYHDTASGSFEASARTFAEVWEDLVPEEGQASSIQGEILRAVGRLAGEDRRNGCVNWDKYYEDFVEFLRTWLPCERVFNAAQRAQLSKDLDAVVANGRKGIDYQVIRVVFGRLIENAAAYCRAYPTPVSIEERPSPEE